MKGRASYVLVGVLLVILGMTSYKHYQTSRTLKNVLMTLAASDSLRQETETIYGHSVVEKQKLQDKNQDLLRRIEGKNEEIRNWTRIAGEYAAALIEGEAEETTTTDSLGNKKVRVTFSGTDKGVRVIGWTETPPPSFVLNVYRPPVLLNVVLSQNELGIWRTTVDTGDPYLVLGSVETEVRPYRPPFFKNFYITAGGGFVGTLNMSLFEVGIGFKDYEFSTLFVGMNQGFILKKRFYF